MNDSRNNPGCRLKAKALKELARDPRFIPGIYNYCDRWCERCSFSNRCLNYAMELDERASSDRATRDLTNEKFWKKLEQTFHDTIEMIRTDARERGIDLDDPTLRDEVREEERKERRLAAMNRPLTRAAMAYVRATDKWLEQARPAFQAKGVELETIARLETGDPGGEAAALQECIEVIRWYQHFIYVKLSRAIGSRANEQLETDEELKAFPKDSDGSAKVALIGIDRSIAAWSGLRTALGPDEADDILDVLAQLAAIRRETETLFPDARAFVRPGFDTGH